MFCAANSWGRRFAFLALFLGPSVAVAQESPPRTALELSSARFYFGELSEEAATSDFNDRGWSAVSLPHTWNRLGEAGTSRSEATNNKRGTGWYRVSFAGPAKERDRRYFLQFDAVSMLADVWLNGTKLGTHAGAFSRFRFDVTDVLRPDEPNLLVVKADNTKPAPGARTQDIIPLDGDFFVYGGIYRGVSLIATDEVHVDMLDHAGPGVYAHPTSIVDGRADIAVLTKLRNDATRSRKVSVVTRIVDEGGREVAKKAETARIASHGQRGNSRSADRNQPALLEWAFRSLSLQGHSGCSRSRQSARSGSTAARHPFHSYRSRRRSLSERQASVAAWRIPPSGSRRQGMGIASGGS